MNIYIIIYACTHQIMQMCWLSEQHGLLRRQEGLQNLGRILSVLDQNKCDYMSIIMCKSICSIKFFKLKLYFTGNRILAHVQNNIKN